jgi:hypothetical protein
MSTWIPRALALVSVLPFTIACEKVETFGPGVPPDELAAAAVARGHTAFLGECAACHASRDAFDLAFFQFTDTTIIRRALGHVERTTADDIVAYVRSLRTPHVTRNMRPFQPNGVLLDDDIAFGIRLFGQDAIPATFDAAALRAIDPLRVSVAVPMPLWSVEEQNIDWMPAAAPPDWILDDQGALARGAIAGYYAAPTVENLTRAVSALRNADRRAASPTAPCIVDDVTRADYVQCFEVRRWTSSLVAQHMLRYGMAAPIHSTLHDAWWDVGNAARKAIQVGKLDFDNGNLNWASWMYLGWMFDPGRHASVYTGTGLQRIGLTRHATFVALRSLVARPRGSMAVWADAQSAARFAPATWTFHATRIAYDHLIERLGGGERPATPDALADAVSRVNSAYTLAQRKLGAADKVALAALRNRVLVELQ